MFAQVLPSYRAVSDRDKLFAVKKNLQRGSDHGNKAEPAAVPITKSTCSREKRAIPRICSTTASHYGAGFASHRAGSASRRNCTKAPATVGDAYGRAE
jgi:hypothetical protein